MSFTLDADKAKDYTKYKDLDIFKDRILMHLQRWVDEATELHSDVDSDRKPEVIAMRTDLINQAKTILGL